MNTELEITRRLLGSSAVVSQEPSARDISVRLDIESFVSRLLLFDTYVLYSVRLKEIPEMVRHFGYEGTLQLLSSGALEIRCECAQYAEGAFGMPPCPPLTFQFHVIEAHIRDQCVIDNLAEVNRAPGLNARELLELQSAVIKTVTQPDNRTMFRSSVAPAFENDVLNNVCLQKSSIRFVLEKDHGIHISEDFNLTVHRVGDDRYRIETNLHEKTSLSIEKLHHSFKTALLGVAGTNQRIGEMKAHTALSGFTDEELPFFRAKMESLADALDSQNQERRFQRLITVGGLPEISSGSRIDMQKLLRIRAEPEAVEFRSWLMSLDKYDDAAIEKRLRSFNARLGLSVQTNTGKAIRFLLTTIAGVVHPSLGIGLSALDSFLWDKLARRSGIAAFAHELYPSIFKPQ